MDGGATQAVVNSQLQEHYANDTAIEIFYKYGKDINPLMALMDAIADNKEGFGRSLITKIVHGTGSAAGTDFTKVLTKAQSATTGAAGEYSRWETTPRTINAVARWARDAMDAAEGKGAGEMFDVMTSEMDLKIALVRKLIAMYAFGDGTGNLGQILTVSTTGFTVSPSIVNRFFRGQDLVACTTTTGATKNSGASLLVTGTDPDTGMVYTSTDPTDTGSGRTAWAVADYVFNYNDRPSGSIAAYTARTMIHGAASWLPGATVTDSSTFDGVTRDGQYTLAGLTKNCAGLDPENALMNTIGLLHNTGSRASLAIMNPDDYLAFTAQKDKSKVVQIALGKYELGFSAFTVNSLQGPVPVVADNSCPAGTILAGPFDDKKVCPRLVYLNKLVNVDDKDGQLFRASASSTGYEMRMYFRGNIVWPAPGLFCRGYDLSI